MIFFMMRRFFFFLFSCGWCCLPALGEEFVPNPLSPEEYAAEQDFARAALAVDKLGALSTVALEEEKALLMPFNQVIDLEKESEQALAEERKASALVEAQMAEFFVAAQKQKGLEATCFPVVAPVSSATSPKVAEVVQTPSLEEEALPTRLPADAPMVITSKDGLYFDADSGLLVYLGDVRVADPRFHLRCDNQLKIYLGKEEKKTPEKKSETKGQPSPTPSDAQAKEASTAQKEDKKDTPKLDFNTIDRLAASGRVVVSRIDEEGKLMRAVGENLTYNAAKKEIILSGGPVQSILQGDNLVETSGPGSYIRIYGNGSVYVKGKQVRTKIKTEEGASPLADKGKKDNKAPKK